MNIVNRSESKVILGDALDVLRGLEPGSVDAVVTDPPYLIQAQSTEGSKYGFADLMNAAHWYAEWYALAWRALKETGHFLTFGNWRSLPVILCAMGRAGMHANACLVWDKEWIGPGHRKTFRPTWELVVHAARPEAVVKDRAKSDIFRCKWRAANKGKTGHKAEKPAPLLADLIGHVCPPGGLVVDPFAGSATTGVACLQTGRRFLGVEIDPAYHAIGERRLADARTKYTLSDPELCLFP